METYIDSKGKIFKAKVIRTEEVENVNKHVYRLSSMMALKKSNLSASVKVVVRNLFSIISLTTRHKLICKRYDKRLTNISMLSYESSIGHIKTRYWESVSRTKEWVFSKEFASLTETEQLRQLGEKREELSLESYERILADYWEARLVMAKEADHEQTVHEFEEQLNATNERVSKMEHEIEVLTATQISLVGAFGKLFSKTKKAV